MINLSILDVLTGGKSNSAESALKRAEAAFAGIKLPTASELTLPELQKYVQAGILTPAEAKAVLQQGNAYNDIHLDPGSTESEVDAINKLKEVGAKGGMTDTMKAQLTEALDKVATSTRGTNASILDQMAQKGIPTSLMANAAMMNENANASRDANLTATQSAGQAEQNAINAMMNEGNLASSLHGQQYNEAANKAAAENAMKQWNAGATNATSEANAGRTQQANLYNTQNIQDVSNQNIGNTNKRSAYNVTVPQQVFGNAMAKASGQAGVNQAQANQYTQSGNQILGLIGAGVGAAANAFAPGAGTAATAKPGMPSELANDPYFYSHGAVVPGKAPVPGDSSKNDIVPARLSPGELVVPRSIASNPDAVKRFVQNLAHQKEKSPVHPSDVHAVLEALTQRRASNA